jgi:hypothetical protein
MEMKSAALMNASLFCPFPVTELTIVGSLSESVDSRLDPWINTEFSQAPG